MSAPIQQPNDDSGGAVLMEHLRSVLRGLIHERWRSMAAFAAERGLSRDWVTNRIGLKARTAIDISDLAIFASALGIDVDDLMRRARDFPLRREWNVIDGEGLELPPLGQGRLPFRTLELVH